MSAGRNPAGVTASSLVVKNFSITAARRSVENVGNFHSRTICMRGCAPLAHLSLHSTMGFLRPSTECNWEMRSSFCFRLHRDVRGCRPSFGKLSQQSWEKPVVQGVSVLKLACLAG